MAKAKVKLHEEHKVLLKTKAKEVVAAPEKYFEDSLEVQQEIEKNSQHVEDTVYKVLKEDAKGQLNEETLQENDHKLHILKKLKYAGTKVAELLHKIITPFIPALTAKVNGEIAEQIQLNENIPEEYKAQFTAVSVSAVGELGDAVAALEFGDDSAGEIVASGEGSGGLEG